MSTCKVNSLDKYARFYLESLAILHAGFNALQGLARGFRPGHKLSRLSLEVNEKVAMAILSVVK